MFKEINDFIHTNLPGVNFIGLSKQNEVFIEFEYPDTDMQNGAAIRLKQEFPAISMVAVVVKPTLEEAEELMEGLNSALEESSPKTGTLLQIKGFKNG